MNWFALKKNLCPQCNKSLLMACIEYARMFKCKCGFTISEQRYKEITSGIISKDLKV